MFRRKACVYAVSLGCAYIGGPTGPTGPTGEGIAILGYYNTLQDLENDHPTGDMGEVYVAGGLLYISDGTQWIQVETLGGPTGPTGTDGAGLNIAGYYATLQDLIVDHGTGNPNDVYVADGLLYISDGTQWIPVENLGGPTGPTGETGPTGPVASSYTIIPFSSQKAPHVYADSAGQPTNVALLGFGYMDIGITSPDVAISLNASDRSFDLGAYGNDNHQAVFSLPFDMVINSIYATVGNYGTFSFVPATMMVFPCIQLYSAEPYSNVFNPITNAYARPAEGIGAAAQASTMRAASKTGLNIELPAGTRIAIGGLMLVEGDTAARNFYLYFTGGIGMTPWIR